MPDIVTNPLHLGLGATAIVQPEFTGMEWYAGYVARHMSDGAEGRLVTVSTFRENWAMWEMHPAGDEVVLCLSGEVTLHQEMGDGSKATVTIREGEYAINPPGCWHTADIEGEAKALFITAGLGSEHRMR